jgi:hypothetical protein
VCRFDDVIPKDITDEALMNRRPRDDLPEVSTHLTACPKQIVYTSRSPVLCAVALLYTDSTLTHVLRIILGAPQVSQEKSKEGLGDIYEREYMRLALGVEGESAESKDKQEMAALFRKLCHVSQSIQALL